MSYARECVDSMDVDARMNMASQINYNDSYLEANNKAARACTDYLTRLLLSSGTPDVVPTLQRSPYVLRHDVVPFQVVFGTFPNESDTVSQSLKSLRELFNGKSIQCSLRILADIGNSHQTPPGDNPGLVILRGKIPVDRIRYDNDTWLDFNGGMSSTRTATGDLLALFVEDIRLRYPTASGSEAESISNQVERKKSELMNLFPTPSTTLNLKQAQAPGSKETVFDPLSSSLL
jgi:hypothetical protein